MTSRLKSLLSPAPEADLPGALLLWEVGASGVDDRIAFLDLWSGPAPSAAPLAAVVRWGARLDRPVTYAMAQSDGLGLGYPAPLSFLTDDGRCVFLPTERRQDRTEPSAMRFLRYGAELAVETLCQAHGAAALSFQSTVTAGDSGGLTLQRFAAAHLPLPPWVDTVTAFSGDWSGELRLESQALGASGFQWLRTVGRSDHHRYPALLLSEGPLEADRGRVLAVFLATSGDHELRIDQTLEGTYQLQGGAYLNPGEGRLAAGERYQSPPLWCVFSDAGSNGLRQRIQVLQRGAPFAQVGLRRPRPVHLNSWEALYFKLDEPALLALLESAKALGVERFVVDDGWFTGRVDDRRALGDWQVDPRRFPRGLGPVADAVVAAGLSFGLWVEPEMVSADSALARTRPQWLRGGDGGLEARHQRVLDLAQVPVQDAIFEALAALLSSLPITYLKWDHNRMLTGQGTGPGVGHRAQLEGLYALLQRVREAFPAVELESCASGGGRLDWGMLRFMHRGWPSDANDPIVRAPIMARSSLFLAPERAGVHVGPSPAHGTGRVTSMAFRCAVALLGHFGLELDPRALGAEDWRTLKAGIARYKRLRALLHSGRVFDYELDPDHQVRVVVAADQREAVAVVLRLGDAYPGRPVRVPCPGLAWALAYRVTVEGPGPAPGEVPGLSAFQGPGLWVAPGYLPAQGLPLQLPRPQTAVVLRFTAEDAETSV